MMSRDSLLVGLLDLSDLNWRNLANLLHLLLLLLKDLTHGLARAQLIELAWP